MSGQPTSVFTYATQYMIRGHALVAADVSRLVNARLEAVIGSVANEFDTRHNRGLLLDMRGKFGQNISDRIAQGETHAEYLRSFIATKDIARPDSITKIRNPSAIDVGPGNIQINTAIKLLVEYVDYHRP